MRWFLECKYLPDFKKVQDINNREYQNRESRKDIIPKKISAMINAMHNI